MIPLLRECASAFFHIFAIPPPCCCLHHMLLLRLAEPNNPPVLPPSGSTPDQIIIFVWLQFSGSFILFICSYTSISVFSSSIFNKVCVLMIGQSELWMNYASLWCWFLSPTHLICLFLSKCGAFLCLTLFLDFFAWSSSHIANPLEYDSGLVNNIPPIFNYCEGSNPRHSVFVFSYYSFHKILVAWSISFFFYIYFALFLFSIVVVVDLLSVQRLILIFVLFNFIFCVVIVVFGVTCWTPFWGFCAPN